MHSEIDRASDALHFLDAGCTRDEWHKIGRAAIAAGLTVDDLDAWSSTGGNYAGTRDVQAAFRTIKPEGGTGAGTLFRLARDAGWTDCNTGPQRQAPAQTRPVEQPRKPAPGMAVADVWGRCEAATNQHGYIAAKKAQGVPLDSLRVVPAGDSLRIAGQSMAGFLMVPAYAPDGELQSAQFIPPPGAGKKVNLPGASMAGAAFTVGVIVPGGVAYIVEGIGQAWACWQATGAAAVVSRWFDCRVEAAPVVYAALEGEAGFKLRAQAWEVHKGRTLPAGLHMVLQPFKLTDPRDVNDLAAVVPAGAVVFLDTLNRAAPTADENSSKDMGEILEGAKRLQHLINGLVVLVHHTGKNTAAGLRGHSSLFAALDCAVEVSRDGERREWKVAKSKDGADGDARPFKLQIETLGIDDHGDPVTSCTVRADTSADEVKRVKLPQGGNQRLLYEGIRGLFKDGAIGKPGAPPLRPCIELEAAVTAGAARLTCASDKKTSRSRDAITGLVSRGVLGLNDGWLWTV